MIRWVTSSSLAVMLGGVLRDGGLLLHELLDGACVDAEAASAAALSMLHRAAQYCCILPLIGARRTRDRHVAAVLRWHRVVQPGPVTEPGGEIRNVEHDERHDHQGYRD